MMKLIVAILLLLIVPNCLFSQSRASASASATIVASAVGIAAIVDTIDNNHKENFQLNPLTTSIAIKKLNCSTKDIKVASFHLLGNNSVYDITLPTDNIAIITKGVNTNPILSFQVGGPTNYSVNNEKINIYVGMAKINMSVPGDSTTDTNLNIVVNYN